VDDPVRDALVEVLAAEEAVAAGGQHFEHPFVDFQDGDIEGAAAQVVDGHLLVLVLAEAVRQRGRRGFVDDPFDFQAGDLAGVLRRLALGVVEVGRHGDDRFQVLGADELLSALFQKLEDHGRDFLRRVLLVADLEPDVAVGRRHELVGQVVPGPGDFGRVEFAPDEALHGIDGVGGVGDGLALGDLAHQPLILIGEGDNGRGGSAAQAVGYDLTVPAFDDRNAGVGCPEVNPDHFCHIALVSLPEVGRYYTRNIIYDKYLPINAIRSASPLARRP